MTWIYILKLTEARCISVIEAQQAMIYQWWQYSFYGQEEHAFNHPVVLQADNKQLQADNKQLKESQKEVERLQKQLPG